MSKINLTIICISKNNFQQIRETFLSIKNSTLENCKLIKIIHLDKSEKHIDAKKIGKDLLKGFNYDFIVQKSNGIFNAFNEALQYVKTNYVYFLNTGDKLYEGSSLGMILEEIKNNRNIELFYFDCVMKYKDNYLVKKSSKNIFKCLMPLSKEFPCHQSCIFSTEIHKKLTYPNYMGGDEFVIRYFLYRGISLKSAKYFPKSICLFDLSGVSSSEKISYKDFFVRSFGYLKIFLFHRIFADFLKIYPFYLFRKKILSFLKRKTYL